MKLILALLVALSSCGAFAPEPARPPYPITWEEQDRLFPKLPAHLARMVLFAVNTGLRDSNVCGLQWSWEVVVTEIARSVFVVPAAAFKEYRPRIRRHGGITRTRQPIDGRPLCER